MNILAIETVTQCCSIAIFYRGEIKQKSWLSNNRDLTKVLGMVDALFIEFGIKLCDIDVIAVDIGPGSFNGVRVGLGITQGFSYGADIPVIEFLSLEVLAATIQNSLILPALDAKIGQIYFALYQTESHIIKQIMPPTLGDPNCLNISISIDRKKLIGIGSGWDQHAKLMIRHLDAHQIYWKAGCYPEANTIIHLADIYGIEKAVSSLEIKERYMRNQLAHMNS